MPTAALTAAQQATYQHQGYLVLPGFKPRAEVQAALARARALAETFDPAAGASRFSTRDRSLVADQQLLDSADQVHGFFEEEALDEQGRLRVPKAQSINKIGHALHDRDPVFDTFSRGLELAAVARGVGLAQPQIWQSMLIFKQPHIGGEVGWHQDASFFVTEPLSVTTFWFALEDATVDNGCLWVEAGGHRGPRGVLRERYVCEQGRLRMEPLDDTPWPDTTGSTTGDTGHAVALPVQAGTLVVFHGLLPHCSAPNRSGRSRVAYTLHVTDATAAYAASNWLQRTARPLRGFGGRV